MKTIQILLGLSAVTLLLLVGAACTSSTQSANAVALPPGPSPAQAEASPQHDHNAEDGIARIKAAEAVRAVRAGEAILVDVRDAGSYDTMHAKGALNVTYQSISEGKFDKLPKDKHLIFYCT